MYSGLSGSMPERPAPASETGTLAIKYDQYTNPAKYGMLLNDEAKLWLAAVSRGLVDKTVTGLATFMGWFGTDQRSRITGGQFAFDAFLKRFMGVPFSSAVSQARANAKAWSVDESAWLRAIETEYGLPAATVPLPPSVVATMPPAPPPPGSAPVPPVSATHPTRSVTQIVVTKDPAFGTPGDGIHFATLARRTIDQDMVTRGWVSSSASSWSAWKGSLVNRTSSDTTSVNFWEDITAEVQLGDRNGDPRARTYWDYANLKAVVGSSAVGSPPKPSDQVDVVAAPTSTSLTPVTLRPGEPIPAGEAPVIPSPIPSGSGGGGGGGGGGNEGAEPIGVGTGQAGLGWIIGLGLVGALLKRKRA